MIRVLYITVGVSLAVALVGRPATACSPLPSIDVVAAVDSSPDCLDFLPSSPREQAAPISVQVVNRCTETAHLSTAPHTVGGESVDCGLNSEVCDVVASLAPDEVAELVLTTQDLAWWMFDDERQGPVIFEILGSQSAPLFFEESVDTCGNPTGCSVNVGRVDDGSSWWLALLCAVTLSRSRRRRR